MRAELTHVQAMQQLMALLAPVTPTLDSEPALLAAWNPAPARAQEPAPAQQVPPAQPAQRLPQRQDGNAALLAALQSVLELQPGQRELLVGLLPMLQR